jgi:hypothetical protein
MARIVKVSSIGAVPPPAPCGETTPDALNRRMIDFWRDEINQVLPDQPDLIVLPELCDRFSGLSQDEVKAQRANRSSAMLEFLQSAARENHCYIAYPTARPARDGSWRNAALMIDRRGEVVGEYHKNHPVVSETTEMGILCGARAPIIECDFGRVAIAICFDLNFDELRLKYKAARPDLIVFPSMYHGGIMQPYWAYSCRAHFVGCVGINNLPSEIYSPVGQRLAASTNYFHFVTATLNLDCRVAHLDFNREKFKALKMKYGTGVTISDPGQLGSVLIASECDDVSAQQMIEEFEIEILDDYFARSLAHHHDACNIGA